MIKRYSFIKKAFCLFFLSVGFCADPIINIWYIGIRESPIYNHYIEIYNPTEEIIDLGEYAFIKGHAQSGAIGFGWGSQTSSAGVSFYRLSGSLFPGSSMGFTRDVSHESLQNAADIVFAGESVLQVSGDDAVGLFKGPGETVEDVLASCDSIPIDAIGTPYNDPGQSWQVSGEPGPANSSNTGFYGVTRFAALVRKPNVGIGNAGDWDMSRGCVVDSCSNDSITTAYESSEWDVIPCYFYDGCDPTNSIVTNGAGAEPSCPDASLDIDSMATYYYDPGTIVVDSTIVLNEFLASSEVCCGVDIFGDAEDFIELYNTGTEEVNLEGWGFGDTEGEVETVAPDTSILPGGHIVLWYTGGEDGFPEIDAKLSSDGEAVYIEDANGNTIVNYSFGNQSDDVSFGMYPDGSGIWQAMNPTPGQSNVDELSIVENGFIVPERLSLFGNFPNPFNPETKIGFYLPRASTVSVVVYSITGKKIQTLEVGPLSQGLHSIPWKGLTSSGSLAVSGVYLYKITSDKDTAFGKMSLIK